MIKPIPVKPAGSPPENPHSRSGEGAQTALAALIRKRKMGENHVEFGPEDQPPKPQADS
jgi:hypothetical protein